MSTEVSNAVRRAILAENEFANRQTSDQDPYDQYEVSVPLSTAGDCLQLVCYCPA